MTIAISSSPVSSNSTCGFMQNISILNSDFLINSQIALDKTTYKKSLVRILQLRSFLKQAVFRLCVDFLKNNKTSQRRDAEAQRKSVRLCNFVLLCFCFFSASLRLCVRGLVFILLSSIRNLKIAKNKHTHYSIFVLRLINVRNQLISI